MKHLRLLAVLTALAVLFSVMAMPAAAYELNVGEKYDGFGTVVSTTTEKGVAGVEGYDYTYLTFTDLTKKGQTVHTLEFNPATTGLIPMAYQAKPSYGYRVNESVDAAIAEGYEVVGAINGEFFSMNSGNYGTLEGRLVTNGRIVADSENRREICLAIDSNGSFNLVESELAYKVKIDGVAVNGGAGMISTINKRFVGTNWWDPWMYFDYETGGKTYTNADVKGVEVVFDKLDGTELTIEGTLKGKVVSVNKDTYGTEMTKDQFVLFAQSTSANYAKLANLTVGQEIEIFADELVKASEDVMKNAMTVSAAKYNIVMNGENNIANIKDDGGLVAQRAQRTAIGVKADGTVVMLCAAGRGTSGAYTYGLTLEKLAKMMIDLDCQYAVALDGGGSSYMHVNGEAKFYTSDNGYIRPVGSSILICKRNDVTTDPTAKEALKAVIDEANAMGEPVTEAKKTALAAAITEAQAAYDNANSVTGDFVREAMDLKAAMAMDDTPEETTTTTTVTEETTTTAAEVTTTTVAKADNSQNSPNTADAGTALLYVLAAAMALTAVAALAGMRKKATR